MKYQETGRLGRITKSLEKKDLKRIWKTFYLTRLILTI